MARMTVDKKGRMM